MYGKNGMSKTLINQFYGVDYDHVWLSIIIGNKQIYRYFYWDKIQQQIGFRTGKVV